MRRALSAAGGALPALAILFAAAAAAAAPAQPLSPEQQAQVLLDSARRAYNEAKYGFAAERFREFLKLHGGHKEAPWAQYGLGLSLLEAPQKDFAAAIQALQQAAGRADFPDRPLALYYLGAAQRGAAMQSLAQAAAKPNEAPQHHNAAKQNFSAAAKSFADAAAAFASRAGKPPAPADGSSEAAWAARARCDHCEMVLRLGQFEEGAKLAAALLADAALGKGRHRPVALYHLGYARFALKDYLAAGRALSQLAPFGQGFGPHARYLLARTHHLAEERPEAEAQYKAVLSDYEQRKTAAKAALQNPGKLKGDDRARAEALLKQPPPEYLIRAWFHLALLQAEEGRWADALGGLSALIKAHPKSPLVPDATLRLGYCQMQLGNFSEAIKTLQPLSQHPQLSDRALWWLGRSQVAAADPKNAPAHAQALAAAMNSLRAAADRAGQLAQSDPQAKARRADILMDLGDTQQRAGQFAPAAATYQAVLTEKSNPDRAEEAMQRQATALHLAGQYKPSDDVCGAFEKAYPTSVLLPAVLFRGAENAYLTATAAAKDPNLPQRDQQLARLFGEAIRRYRRVIRAYPEFRYVNLARHGLAASHYRLGRYARAGAVLATIPPDERTGEMATVDYLLADCIIRSFPAETHDAVRAARLVEQAGEAAKLLERFLGAAPNSPEAPDALLKLGRCHQRISGMLAGAAERRKALTDARGAYERFLRQFGKAPSLPTALAERAECLSLLGDVNAAIGELNRFRADPLRLSEPAPLALLRLSELLRAQNRPAESAALMAQCRTWHEANLLKDPARRAWVASLRYEHALALKASGKLAEARGLFEALPGEFPDHPEAANALWRTAQCRREELAAQLAAARQAAGNPQQAAAARQSIETNLADLRRLVGSLQTLADGLGRGSAGSEPHLHLLYEAAWCCRTLAEAEIEEARGQLQRQGVERATRRRANQAAPGPLPPAPAAPEIPLSAISLRLAERAARDHYRQLIVASEAGEGRSGPSPLALQARLELAEMLSQRGQDQAALALLSEALEKDPPADLSERIRLRLASCLLARNDPRAALAQAEAVARNAKGPLHAHARYLIGEAHARRQDWANAIKQLVPFRDQGPLQRVRGVSERALLRLGHAYAQAGQWDASRHTFAVLAQRFGQGPWAAEAHYGVGWSWQQQKQYDQAVAAYAEVTRRTVAEVAARAQLQAGLCRLEQKRHPEAISALLAVPLTYDYPELTAAAWCEAGRAYMAMKQPAQAAALWRRVIRDCPASRWAGVARQRLAGIE